MKQETKTKTKAKEPCEGTFTGELVELGRNVWLAGLGAVMNLEEEGSRYFRELVEKGRKFDERDKTPVEKTFHEATARVREFTGKVETGVRDATRPVLNRFGIPSHDQIQELIDRVDRLNEKIGKEKA